MTKELLNNKIDFIIKHINDIDKEERKHIYRIIIESGIDDSKVIEKGTGIEIKFCNIKHIIITQIYQMVFSSIQKKMKELEAFPDN